MACCPTCGRPLPEFLAARELEWIDDPPEVHWRGQALPLWQSQARILGIMIRRGGRASHAAIVAAACRPDTEAGEAKMHICRLRKRLAELGVPVRIASVNGWGYQLASPINGGRTSTSHPSASKSTDTMPRSRA